MAIRHLPAGIVIIVVLSGYFAFSHVIIGTAVAQAPPSTQSQPSNGVDKKVDDQMLGIKKEIDSIKELIEKSISKIEKDNEQWWKVFACLSA